MLSTVAKLVTSILLAFGFETKWTAIDAYILNSSTHLQLRNYTYSFEEYIHEYGKVYTDDAEYEMRKSLFEQRLEQVRVHNEDAQLSRLWRKGINSFSDRTPEELRMTRGYNSSLGHYLRSRDAETLGSNNVAPPIPDLARLSALPSELDWRDIPGVLTAVKEQGHCGSCWAFSAVETIESRWFIATGTITDLSVQNVVSCAPNPYHCGGEGGCRGATAEIAFEYVQQNGGIPSEWMEGYLQYYNNVTEKCPLQVQGPILAKLSNFTKLRTNDLVSVMEALQEGPIAVNVDATHWHAYESGVFTGCDSKNITLNHAVQLVGYGVDNESGTPFWIIRNSWGPNHGEKGFFRIARETGVPVCGTDYKPQDGTACDGQTDPITVCGTCGILYDASYPEIARPDVDLNREDSYV